MAAEITLFRQSATRQFAQVPSQPFDSKTATFTADRDCLMRVYANGTNVTLKWSSLSSALTVPSGTVEYFGISSGDIVTVA